MKAAREYLQKLDTGVGERWSWPNIRKRTIKVLKTLGSKLPAGSENQEIVLSVIRQILWDDLTSGAHHTYRGVLSAGGHDRKALFMHFEMIRFSKKLITIEESNQTLLELDRAIRTAG
jgi:hypothetical protein